MIEDMKFVRKRNEELGKKLHVIIIIVIKILIKKIIDNHS